MKQSEGTASDGAPELNDFAPSSKSILEEVLAGLCQPEKSIPSKLLYDARGSELFERICDLEEYYLTRTEVAIMQASAAEMAELLGPNCLLIEYGTGSGIKTRMLLDHLDQACAYVPIDISREALKRSAAILNRRYPGLEVSPVCADYTGHYEIPATPEPPSRRVVYFPGSTIGNFTPEQAEAFLAHIVDVCGPEGGLLIGVDLEKDPRMLERAYDDDAGVTAAFELNVLARLNREIGATFDLERFEYGSRYNPVECRIEMFLVSRASQRVRIGETEVAFQEGEQILIEYSYKYSLERFAKLAESARLTVEQVWTDPRELFSVQYLSPTGLD